MVAVRALAASVVLLRGRVNWLMCIAIARAGFVISDLILRSYIKARQDAIARDLPEVVDLLNLCVNAGADFMGAMQRVVREFRPCPIVQELSTVMHEMRMGKRRRDALRGFSKRIPISDVSSFVRTLVQADRMGTPIAEVLAVHAEDVRFQRWTRAERAALKAPIKILAPLVLCILPCVAIIVAAPIFIQFTHMNITSTIK